MTITEREKERERERGGEQERGGRERQRGWSVSEKVSNRSAGKKHRTPSALIIEVYMACLANVLRL